MEMDVRRLAEKIEAAQAILEEIRKESGCDAFSERAVASLARQETALQTAERAQGERRKRAEHFRNQQMFGEPAWDILLDLYIHQVRNEQTTVKRATVGPVATAGTTLRWLQVLDAEGLIFFEADPTDEERRLLRLTPEGYESITRYLEAIGI